MGVHLTGFSVALEGADSVVHAGHMGMSDAP